jgi:hypothetical protein
LWVDLREASVEVLQAVPVFIGLDATLEGFDGFEPDLPVAVGELRQIGC